MARDGHGYGGYVDQRGYGQHGGYGDNRGYQPDPYGGGGPPPRKRSKKKIFAVAGGVFVLLIVVAAVAGGGSGTQPTTVSPAAAPGQAPAGQAPAAASVDHAEDAQITECAPDAAGWAAAKVTVTNNSSKASNYIITITFETADGATQIGTGIVAVNGLQPGQNSPQETSSLKDAQPGYVCKVTDITRYAA